MCEELQAQQKDGPRLATNRQRALRRPYNVSVHVSAGRPTHMLAGFAAVALVVCGAATVSQVQAPATFAARITQLSERGGYFDTDNLISNEKSYLHVIPALHDAGITGGAYVGVGP